MVDDDGETIAVLGTGRISALNTTALAWQAEVHCSRLQSSSSCSSSSSSSSASSSSSSSFSSSSSSFFFGLLPTKIRELLVLLKSEFQMTVVSTSVALEVGLKRRA